MARATVLVLLLALIATPAWAHEEPPRPAFQPGQQWAYRTRPGEEASTLTILKLERVAGKPIVHIAIGGLHIKNASAPTGYTAVAQHIPIAEDALSRSVTRLRVPAGPVPDFKQGYEEWKKAKGGVFTITVAELVAVMEKSFNP